MKVFLWSGIICPVIFFFLIINLAIHDKMTDEWWLLMNWKKITINNEHINYIHIEWNQFSQTIIDHLTHNNRTINKSQLKLLNKIPKILYLIKKMYRLYLKKLKQNKYIIWTPFTFTRINTNQNDKLMSSHLKNDFKYFGLATKLIQYFNN